jgi:DNA polymerase alpha subunit A
MKGIDIVRRDWSQISKDVGNNILNCILSGNQKEEIISNIFEELKKVSLLLDEKKIPLKDFIITKQLAKNIDDYNDLKSLPHVRVAKRLKEKGDMTIKVNSYIPYIVCLSKDSNNDNNKNIKSITERSYHPKEIENDPSLKIDFNWYKENQILSIVKRLVQHIQEISNNQLCDMLGIENKNYYDNNNNNDVSNYNNFNNKFNFIIIGLKFSNFKRSSELIFISEKTPSCFFSLSIN